MLFDFERKTTPNKVEFFIEGESYYERYLNMIAKAQHSIHLQTYIFQMDDFGKTVRIELLRALQRGVKVYVVVDAIGSAKLVFNEKEWTDAGLFFFKFNGLSFKGLGQWGRRLHHKVLLVDDKHALIGGINVVSNFYGKKVPQTEKQTNLDFALYISGPAIRQLAKYCHTILYRTGGPRLEYIPRSFQNEDFPDIKEVPVLISINDWIYKRWQITQNYSYLTMQARKEITLVNSYFFPRRKFINQLVQARNRGVRVRLILPKYSDWPTYVLATQYLYSYILKNGIEIYQWNKSLLHGKLASIDDEWCTIGSFNLNYTSYQQNLEINVDIFSTNFTKHVNSILQDIINTGCERITLESLSRTTFKICFLRFFYYILLSLIANFSVGIAFQEEFNSHRLYRVLNIAVSLIFLFTGLLGIFIMTLPSLVLFFIGFFMIYRQVQYNNRNV